MNNLLYYLTFASAMGSGLLAGIFFTFSAFIMTSIARLPAEQGISAMQSINTTILQSLFILVFMGTTFLSIILGIASSIKLGTVGAAYVLTGSLLIFVGAFLVTIVFNVPLKRYLSLCDFRESRGNSSVERISCRLDALESCTNDSFNRCSGLFYHRSSQMVGSMLNFSA
ncbi:MULTISPECIES: DUF1772 domain-containing protein [unclassified Paenibacillus]|uniref:anthrone oxygenase family protein n=1 Tax=unclassified Paenibacillus TaxID=185978 RepID=UPI002784E143|nr:MULTISPECIES: hypothetical protein [unclassified Paenibacillus]MDQ0899036.1 putative membrane protein [Paenibacillus sp. V4I7]MDQ0914978.1 putative membrane protein [Paenibacillus sp. V4I5]